MIAALVAKALAYGNRLGPERALVWLTPGAVAGVLLGATALVLALSAPRRAQLHGALVCALLWLVAANVVPPNPYAVDVCARAALSLSVLRAGTAAVAFDGLAMAAGARAGRGNCRQLAGPPA